MRNNSRQWNLGSQVGVGSEQNSIPRIKIFLRNSNVFRFRHLVWANPLCSLDFCISGLVAQQKQKWGSVKSTKLHRKKFYKIIPSFYVMKRKNGLFGLTIFEFLLYLKRMSTSKNNFEENPGLVFKIFCIKLYHGRICIVALAQLCTPEIFRATPLGARKKIARLQVQSWKNCAPHKIGSRSKYSPGPDLIALVSEVLKF